jgi:hypothetical protein
VIRGNGEHNVFLSGGATLSVADALDENALIGVSMETGSGVFTSGLSGRGSEYNFSADEDNCIVTVHDDGEAYIDKELYCKCHRCAQMRQ